MPSLRLVAAAALLGLVAAANAQPIYRIVGPDGRVTFSDRPPPDAPGGKAATAPVMTLPGAAAGGDTTASLPFDLRNAVGRYPVTLYTRPGCGPCDAGRNYLSNRGIPFAERTITSQEDIEALQRLAGTPTLPFATIGGQQLKGYSEVEWGQFLDAAGYPKTSQLPPSYRRPAASPLVVASRPVQAPQAEPDQAAAPAPGATPAPTGPSPSNPAGIQF